MWVIEDIDGEPTERCVVRATDLLGDSEHLSPAERARRERLREAGAGITSFSADDSMTLVTFAMSGQLWLVEVTTGSATCLDQYEAVIDPRLNPQGSLVAFTSGCDFVVVDVIEGNEMYRLVSDSEHVTYGLADFVAAEELSRHRGHWWSPQGDELLIQRTDNSTMDIRWIADPTFPEAAAREHRYPSAGTTNPRVSLIHLDLGANTPTACDVDSPDEYLAQVTWNSGGALITYLNREQTQETSYVLRGNSLELIHTKTDSSWIDCGFGFPHLTRDGSFINSVESDIRRIAIGKEILDCQLHVESLISHDNSGTTFTAYTKPWFRGVYHLSVEGVLSELSEFESYATALQSGDITVISQHSMRQPVLETYILFKQNKVHTVSSHAAQPPVAVKGTFHSLTDSEIPALVIFPENHRPGSHKLPVIAAIYGGPHHSEVIAAAQTFATDQWLANQGFAVVIVDNRGTPGKSPAWERAVQGNLADPVLEDQVAAMNALFDLYPEDLDTERVGIHGWSFGGYLSALAVLDRPDVYKAGWAGAPVTDWRLYDTAYTERYLGHPDIHAAAYERSSLISRAAKLTQPLMLIHGLADDNVLAAHSLQLSGALLAAGKSHSFLPLAGVSHMTPQETVSSNLLLLMRDFFYTHL